MKPYFIAPDAAEDVDRAADYLESQRRGYGQTFRDTIDSAIDRICKMPGIYPKYRQIYRRCIVKRFSYLIYFQEFDDYILIVKVVHGRRDQDAAFDPTNNPPRN